LFKGPIMPLSWKESVYLQREQLARRLHVPLAELARRCAQRWGSRERLNQVLLEGFDGESDLLV
jgi:hypothetical protein